MRKWITRLALVFAALLLVLVALYLYALATFEFDFASPESTQAHTRARDAFMADLPQTECLRAQDIIPIAEARGWHVRSEPDFNWCVAPDTLQSWLRVTIEPPLPFSTDNENAEFFGFDAQGCAVDWTYASGPGSTCPDR